MRHGLPSPKRRDVRITEPLGCTAEVLPTSPVGSTAGSPKTKKEIIVKVKRRNEDVGSFACVCARVCARACARTCVHACVCVCVCVCACCVCFIWRCWPFSPHRHCYFTDESVTGSSDSLVFRDITAIGPAPHRFREGLKRGSPCSLRPRLAPLFCLCPRGRASPGPAGFFSPYPLPSAVHLFRQVEFSVSKAPWEFPSWRSG